MQKWYLPQFVNHAAISLKKLNVIFSDIMQYLNHLMVPWSLQQDVLIGIKPVNQSSTILDIRTTVHALFNHSSLFVSQAEVFKAHVKQVGIGWKQAPFTNRFTL